MSVTADRTARLLFGILLLGMSGTLAELLLMEHTDGFWQLVPLVLLAAGIVGVVLVEATRRAVLRRLVSALMGLFVAAGAAGLVLHYRGNAAFERELSPEVAGWALVREALMGATPALAPGAMALLGLLGLLYTRMLTSTFRPEE